MGMRKGGRLCRAGEDGGRVKRKGGVRQARG